MISIDSTKLRIPLHEVDVIDSALNETRYETNAHGDLLREWKNNKLKIVESGIKTHYGIESQVDKNKRTSKYLVILFNSKLLRARYLEGITLDNCEVVYKELMSQGVVSIPFETFLRGELTDTDLKKDLIIPPSNFDFMLSKAMEYAHEYGQRDRGYNPFRKKDNKGIEFGERKKATPSYPYLKYYSKFLEMYGNEESDSFLFAKTFGVIVHENTVRAEFTIKNRQQWKKYKIERTSLGDLLSLNQDKLEEIMSIIVSVHLLPRTSNKTANMVGLKPEEIINAKSIQLLLDSGFSISFICNALVEQIGDRHTKSRKLKKLEMIYNLHLKNTDSGKFSEAINETFNAIGWKE